MKLSVACTGCRTQHIRCDSKKPTCSRCADSHLACIYLPSRRGGRRKPRQPRLDREVEAQEPVVSSPFHEDSSISSSNTGAPLEGCPEPTVTDTRLVCLYYEHFHPAHPILVPSRLYESRNYPRYLHHVVTFIGSQWSTTLSRDALSETTVRELNASTERTPCIVQALLLYSIILCARNELDQAQLSLARAIDIALELRMYGKDFATTFSGNQETEAESLRRTWWELFIVEIHLATLQSDSHRLRCIQVPYDVPLPCEESLYSSQDSIPTPPSLESFGMRLFMEDDDDEGATSLRCSSYSYRIEAARILARVLLLNSLPESHPDHLQAVTNALASWVNHLPRHKLDAQIIDQYGNLDEMLFQAHVTIHYAAILLHLPRSNLQPRFPDRQEQQRQPVVCPVTPSIRLCPSSTRHVHDVLATEATKQLTNILSIRLSAKGHTPLTVFGMVLCGLVQLATSERHSPTCAEHHHNRVILVLGCLKRLGHSWSLAKSAHDQLRRAAAQTQAQSQLNLSFSSRSSRSVGLSSSAGTEEENVNGNDNRGSDPDWNHSLGSANTDTNISTNTIANANANATLNYPLSASPLLLSEYFDPTCSDPYLWDRLCVLSGV